MRRSIPRYCLLKPTGQARVIIGGRHICLGVYGTPDSHKRYTAEIANR